MLAAAMERGGDPEGAARIRRGFSLIDVRPPRAVAPTLETALATRDGAVTSRAAIRARLPLAESALVAVRVGDLDYADDAATRVLRAEPGNADALVALLAARDLGSRGTTPLTRFTTSLPADRTPLSVLGRQLMSELLARRAGAAAARAFAAAVPTP